MKTRAAVFAGQGAQFVGMGKDLADAYPECRELFDRAAATLGANFLRVCFEGPIEELTKSNNCQPALFVTSVACYRAWLHEAPGAACTGAAGLSLGEWSALHVAGALTFEDTIRVLEARGRFMQQACEEQDGAMVSVIGLSADALSRICAATGVEMANLNSAEQTVLSGARKGIEEAGRLATEAGAKKTVVLNVAGAFHSALMNSAAKRLADMLADVPIRAPSMPVVSNVTGRPHGNPQEIRDAMVRQVTSSVRWMSSIEWFKSAGVNAYVEFGPGKVLSGLIKRIDKDASTASIQDRSTLEKAVAAEKSGAV